MTEDCECAIYSYTYLPQETEMMKFFIRDDWHRKGLERYYKHAKHTYNDKESYNEYDYVSEIYNGEEFEKVNQYRVVFLDEETCKEYCEYLNKKKEGAE